MMTFEENSNIKYRARVVVTERASCGAVSVTKIKQEKFVINLFSALI